jgi:nucleoid-associated protein YgaU
MARFARLAAIFALSIVLVNCPSTPKTPPTTVAAPTFSPAEGTYTSAQSVTISTTTEGAEIRYTTDSTDPTSTTGTVYAAPISVSATTTIKAIATKAGDNDSSVSSATYTIGGKVADVQFDPNGGSFTEATSVTLSSATDGAQVYYTTDGSDPSPSGGTRYAGPVSVSATQTLKAMAVKQGWKDSGITSADFTVNLGTATGTKGQPVTDVEVTEARNALARAKEVDADFFDPDNYDMAKRLLYEAIDIKINDPDGARQKLGSSKEHSDKAFGNSVERAAADMSAALEAARQRLLKLEADKYLPSNFEASTAGIDEAGKLFAAEDYAGARARAYKALKDMSDLRDLLDTRLAKVRSLKFDTEQAMSEAETSNAYAAAPDQKDKVTSLYLAGLDAFSGYKLDDAEENFGAALQAARDTLRIAQEAAGNQEAEKAKAEQLQAQAMKALVDASKLTVVTEDGTVIKPRNWTDEDFLKQIDKMIQDEQKPSNGPQSIAIPSDRTTVVLADDSSANLLLQARDLWTQGLTEKAAGNYAKAQDYFNEALRYIEIYKSYAVKGVYTVRLIPDKRDCLWRIAEYPDVYADPYKWPSIWRRNRKLIQNPDLIYPGWQLVIPPQ